MGTISFSDGLKRYARNTGFLLVEQAVRTIVTITVWVYVIRYLGPERFGLFSYALSFVFLFKVLSELGLDHIVVRELVKNSEKKNIILGTTFFLKICGALLAVILITITVFTLSLDFYTRGIVILMSLRLLFQSLRGIDLYFQSLVLSKYVVYSQLISLAVTSLFCILGILWQRSVAYFITVVVLESAVLAAGLIGFYSFNKQRLISWKFKEGMARYLLKDSWPLIVSSVAVSIYLRIDQIIIKSILGATALGHYSAAVRLSEAINYIPIILTTSLFPAIIQARFKEETEYRDRLQALFSMLLWISICFALAITLVSRPLVHILFGTEFNETAAVLRLHVWSCVFVFLGVVRSKWAISENLQIYSMIYAIIGAVLNIGLNLILIPEFGINGAAWATIISFGLSVVFCNLLSKKTRLIFVLQLKAINLFISFKKSLAFIFIRPSKNE